MPIGKIGDAKGTENSTNPPSSPPSAVSTATEHGALGKHAARAEENPSIGASTLKQDVTQQSNHSKIPVPARDVAHIEKLTLKLFGAGNHFKTTTPWIQLQNQILKSPMLNTIPLEKLEGVFDQLQTAGIKGNGHLTAIDLLSILRKIDVALADSKSGDALPKTTGSERTKLSKDLSDTIKAIINKQSGNPNNQFLEGLNEYRSKEELELLLEAYMADIPQTQVEKIMGDCFTYNDEDPAVNRLQALLHTINEATKEIKTLELQSLAKTAFTVTKGKKIGEGGFGDVFEVQLNGTPKLLKEFKGGSYPIKLDKTNPDDPKLLRTQEVTATFLHPEETKVVIAPTHYLVRESRNGSPPTMHLVEVRDKGFREWAKDLLLSNEGTPGYQLEIAGSFQDYAKGTRLLEYLETTDSLEIRRNMPEIFRSYLDALEVLSRRGFVHGDLKLENSFYDSTTGKISLIDTGGLSKISKKADRFFATEFDLYRGATLNYTIPKVLAKQKAGFEQDIFSVGIQVLETLDRANYSDGSNYLDLLNQITYEQELVVAKKRDNKKASQNIREILKTGLVHAENPTHRLYKYEKLALEAIKLGIDFKVLANIELSPGTVVAGNKSALSRLKKILN